MDTSDYPSLARLADLNAQLARQGARVDAIVTAQLDSVERLFRAATTRDWDAVARASDALARQADATDNRAISKSARAVCDALRLDPSGVKATPRLNELLNACRAAKLGR